MFGDTLIAFAFWEDIPPSIFLEDSLAKSIQEMKTIKEVLPKLHKKRSSFHYFSTKIETRNCWSIERTIFPTILKCMMLNDYGWFGDLLIWSLVAPNSIAFDAFSENVKQHDRIFPKLSDNYSQFAYIYVYVHGNQSIRMSLI